jgi:hypothetical protein
MENFNEMMRTLIGYQQKTLGFMYENTKTPVDYLKDYNTLMENNMKFHTAALKYHESIIEMADAMKNMIDIYRVKP